MEIAKESLITIGITLLVIVMVITGLSLLLRLIPGVYGSVARSSYVGGKILKISEVFSTLAYIPGIIILYIAYFRKK